MEPNDITPSKILITPESELPEKYIRTFAGDMETVQKGGTPDLVPLVKTPSVPDVPIPIPTPTPEATPLVNVPILDAEDLAKIAPLKNEPLSADAPKPDEYIRTFGGDIETVQKGGTPDLAPFPTPKERLVEASPTIVEPSPVSAPVVTPTPEPIPLRPTPPLVTPLETYSSDFTDRMKKTNASTATVLAAEQDSAQGAPQAPEESSRSNLMYSIGGIVLLIAGISSGVFAYLHYTSATTPVVIPQTVSSPIFVDDREEISSTGPTLMQAIEQSVNRPLATGSIRLIYNSSTTTPDSIFSAMQVPAPDILLRNINKEGSMAGVVFVNGSQSPFFILSVASYSNTFSGMLSWESTIRRDIGTLFPPYAVPVVATTSPVIATTTATTTVKKTVLKTVIIKKSATATTTPPALSIPIFVPAFHDEVVSNHDVRIYRDATGRSVILYGYWNQSTLVIARDTAAFIEILNRLATAHTP